MQTNHLRRASDRGAALVVSLIMLVLITIVVITALNIGSANFRAVSNTQFRDEAVAAAEVAVQQVIGSNFTVAPAPLSIDVDLDNDGAWVPDYVVDVAQPECIFATIAEQSDPSSEDLDESLTVSSTWNTVWELDARIAPGSSAGEADVRIKTGVRVLLSQAEKDTVCP
jgi:hypothetical protein